MFLQSHVLIFRANCDRDNLNDCVSDSERFSIGEISLLSKISSMPLCKACPGCGGMVNIRKVSCSCGHVFITTRSKPRLTYGKEWYQKASNE